MGRLSIRCPQTKLPVLTSVRMDRGAFEGPADQLEGSSIPCPHCGTFHRWSKEDATYLPDEAEREASRTHEP